MNRTTVQLAWPLAVSIVLHLSAAWWFSPGYTADAARKTKAVALTVSMTNKDRAAPAPVLLTEPIRTPEPLPVSVGATEVEGQLTQKARFLVPPDLSMLEEVPVPFPGSLSIRLHVNALGTVDRITVLRSDPVPQELRDGLLSRFENSRLSPALAGSRSVASTLDLVIRFEPAPTPMQGDR